jgi:hypothetical protein
MAFLSGSFGPTRKYPGAALARGSPAADVPIRLLKDVYLRGGSFFGHPKEIAVLVWARDVVIAWRRFGWGASSDRAALQLAEIVAAVAGAAGARRGWLGGLRSLTRPALR